MLPPRCAPGRFPAFLPARGKERGRVALFTGCTGALVDRQTLDATVQVLVGLGYGVHIPKDQACCGALHMHNGEPEGARRLARRNLAAFSALKLDAVISVASGCGAQLAEYYALDPHQAEWNRFAAKVRDINAFLSEADKWPAALAPAPLKVRVAVHDPCSLRNVLKQQDKPYSVLERIPGVTLHPLPSNARCCGAAGSYMLTEPEMSRALLADKLVDLEHVEPDIVATSNIGCAMHLRAGLRARGSKAEVLHPVVLLERQLRATPER